MKLSRLPKHSIGDIVKLSYEDGDFIITGIEIVSYSKPNTAGLIDVFDIRYTVDQEVDNKFMEQRYYSEEIVSEERIVAE